MTFERVRRVVRSYWPDRVEEHTEVSGAWLLVAEVFEHKMMRVH